MSFFSAPPSFFFKQMHGYGYDAIATLLLPACLSVHMATFVMAAIIKSARVIYMNLASFFANITAPENHSSSRVRISIAGYIPT